MTHAGNPAAQWQHRSDVSLHLNLVQAEAATLEQLGTARKVTIRATETTIIADAANREEIDMRVKQVWALLSRAPELAATFDAANIEETANRPGWCLGWWLARASVRRAERERQKCGSMAASIRWRAHGFQSSIVSCSYHDVTTLPSPLSSPSAGGGSPEPAPGTLHCC